MISVNIISSFLFSSSFVAFAPMDLLVLIESTTAPSLSGQFSDWKDAVLGLIGRLDFVDTTNIAIATVYDGTFSVVHWPGVDRTQEWANIQR